jgi:hypothetical protein
LVLIDNLNAKGPRALVPGDFAPPPYLDVNGDGYISPLDVLALIDYLNARASGG